MDTTAATATPANPDVPQDAKTMALLAHLLGIFFGFIPSLIIWLTKKEENPFIEDQAKEALNFQITMAIGWIISFVLLFVVIGGLLMPALWIVNIIFSIIGAMKAKDGIAYRYPFALRLIK